MTGILNHFRLDGKTALVTGGGRGLGRAMAVALAQAGADVITLDRSNGEEVGADVRAAGRRHLHLTAELSASAEEAHSWVNRAAEAHGRLDILVNNAGIIRRTPAIDVTEADWDVVIAVNLKAVFFLSQAAARVMRSNGGGKIIQIASMLSYQGGVFVPAYTAAKSAVLGLTRALANEWAPLGINVNAIAPGYMATDNTAALRADPDRSTAILGRIPVGRWGASEDLAGAVVFLASPASDYVHGITLPVDGGWLAR